MVAGRFGSVQLAEGGRQRDPDNLDLAGDAVCFDSQEDAGVALDDLNLRAVRDRARSRPTLSSAPAQRTVILTSARSCSVRNLQKTWPRIASSVRWQSCRVSRRDFIERSGAACTPQPRRPHQARSKCTAPTCRRRGRSHLAPGGQVAPVALVADRGGRSLPQPLFQLSQHRFTVGPVLGGALMI